MLAYHHGSLSNLFQILKTLLSFQFWNPPILWVDFYCLMYTLSIFNSERSGDLNWSKKYKGRHCAFLINNIINNIRSCRGGAPWNTEYCWISSMGWHISIMWVSWLSPKFKPLQFLWFDEETSSSTQTDCIPQRYIPTLSWNYPFNFIQVPIINIIEKAIVLEANYVAKVLT